MGTGGSIMAWGSVVFNGAGGFSVTIQRPRTLRNDHGHVIYGSFICGHSLSVINRHGCWRRGFGLCSIHGAGGSSINDPTGILLYNQGAVGMARGSITSGRWRIFHYHPTWTLVFNHWINWRRLIHDVRSVHDGGIGLSNVVI
jgi:hypothetical protein